MEADCQARRTGDAMGTTFLVAVHQDDRDLLDAAVAQIHDLERRWSRFLPDSEISILNRTPGVAVIVSPDTFQVLQAAADGAAATHGLFDPTVHDTMHAIGYDRSFAQFDPGEAAPAGAVEPLPAPGPTAISFDQALNAVTLPPGVRVDLGGIGKGSAADLVTAGLLDHGARSAAVSIGGDLRVRAASGSQDSWTVTYDGAPLAMEPLVDGGVCTSTVTRRRWTTAAGDVHHLVDPRTGRPTASGIESVTVVGATAQQAEVLTKAAMVSGTGAPALLEQFGVIWFIRWIAPA